MDLRVRMLDARLECQRRRAGGCFLVDERDVLDGQSARHLTRGVGSHAVSHDEQPAAAAILFGAPRHEHRFGVLVVGPSPTNVGQLAVLESGAGSHASNPGKAGGWGKEREGRKV